MADHRQLDGLRGGFGPWLREVSAILGIPGFDDHWADTFYESYRASMPAADAAKAYEEGRL